MSNSWKETILNLAPTVATALGGPLAGVAVSALGKVFGISNATTELVADVINSGKLTPDQISEIKKLELQFQNDEAERGFKYAEIAYKNTQGARDMQIATRSKVPAVLSVLITLGFFGILIGMMWGKLTTTDNQALLIMLGALAAAWGAIVNYWFGSSHGSQTKDEVKAQKEAVEQLKK